MSPAAGAAQMRQRTICGSHLFKKKCKSLKSEVMEGIIVQASVRLFWRKEACCPVRFSFVSLLCAC